MGSPRTRTSFYLRGRFHRNQWTLEGFQKSVEYFERALALEPKSSQILAALSEAQVLVAMDGSVPNELQFGLARSAAERRDRARRPLRAGPPGTWLDSTTSTTGAGTLAWQSLTVRLN